ncbi:nitroreductase family protein [uncultured Desulfobacter sp.]|uniref:nitroreductase family protein n=1 Tax=uncultured Desulfobacter sp. TaxID=240139 RepID=UPI002AABE060|nr:nitroreductase family protein [uncultured Desulfobacter sp.]
MGIDDIIIDKEKCVRDGRCAAICPSIFHVSSESGGYPVVLDSEKEMCMGCGQCVAICPAGAITNGNITLDTCPAIEPDLTINEKQMIQFLRSRRSVRVYKRKAVEPAVIEKLIRIAQYAPSAGNGQEVEWTVFNGRARLDNFVNAAMGWLKKEIQENPTGEIGSYAAHHAILKDWETRKLDGLLWGAPALLIASSDQDSCEAMVNITLALSYLDLAAPALGLGTCWTGTFNEAMGHNPLKAEIGLPPNHTHHYAMILGYPRYPFLRLPPRKPPVIHWQAK